MTLWIKAVQGQAFSREIQQLSRKDSKQSLPLVRQLRLYLDDNAVLRCRGRLESAPLDDQSKFPVLLPRNEHFTKLVALAAHVHVLHSGVRETLTQLRQKYWVPRGRQFVRSLIRKCVTCRKTDGPPYRPVSSPPLPPSRVSEGQAFSTTGVDYAGPLYVKGSTGDQSPTKVYIVLFTCAVVRAVPLELVEDLSSESFIRAFRRFVSRRGVSERLISDNAKNFKDCSKRITSLSSQILEAEKTQRYLASHGIRWQFIVERAPWWGGFYERLVGSVKRCLKKSLGKTLLSFPDIVTMVTEVEAVLNSRPLTYLYPDIEDNPPLTPAHFLCGYRLSTLPNLVQDKEDVDPLFIPPSAQAPWSGKQVLSRRIKHYESLMTSRWRREYLLNLREFHRQPLKGPLARKDSSVKIGDVVLVQENLPRSRWRLALVEKLIEGRDGWCRAAQVKLANGNRIQRPLQLLFPLEVQDTVSDHKEAKSEDINSTSDPADPQRPSKRKAAIEARQKIHMWTQ